MCLDHEFSDMSLNARSDAVVHGLDRLFAVTEVDCMNYCKVATIIAFTLGMIAGKLHSTDSFL